MAKQFLPPLYDWMEVVVSQSSSPRHGCTAATEVLLFCFARKGGGDLGEGRLVRVLRFHSISALEPREHCGHVR